MIPDKTPALAAIAWITVVMAYAWASNRDYDDAVLVRRSGLQAATTARDPVPILVPAVTRRGLKPAPTVPTGDRK